MLTQTSLTPIFSLVALLPCIQGYHSRLYPNQDFYLTGPFPEPDPAIGDAPPCLDSSITTPSQIPVSRVSRSQPSSCAQQERREPNLWFSLLLFARSALPRPTCADEFELYLPGCLKHRLALFPSGLQLVSISSHIFKIAHGNLPSPLWSALSF